MDTQDYLKSDESTGMEVLYRGGVLSGIEFYPEVANKFNSECQNLDLDSIASDLEYSQDFLIPDSYRNLDVLEYIAALVPNEPGRQQRVAQELELYQSRNLFPVLRMLIYIVDTMRAHDIVWGVGRGSSVASYCLYLIGVHKIDSYRHELSIKEFLK